MKSTVASKGRLVRKQLAAVSEMSHEALKEKFLELNGFECGATTARNLRKRIAYRLQEIYFGGISDADAAVLDRIADSDPLSRLEQAPARRLSRTPGTLFSRMWKGVTYEVLAVGDGTFEYAGEKYKSLSAVARKITGTRWNGKLFFGVR